MIIRHLFILLYLHIILVEIYAYFDALYPGIGCITLSYLILYFLILIYRHHFFIILNIFLFPLLITLLFFLTHVVSPIRLRLHFTQEIPLPPFISIALDTLRAMLILVGGKVEEGSIVNNVRLIC